MAADFGENIAVSLVPDFTRFDQEYRAEVEKLEHNAVSIPVSFKIDKAKLKADLEAAAREISGTTDITVRVRLDTTAARAELARLRAEANVGGGGGGSGGGGGGGGGFGGGFGSLLAGGGLGLAALTPAAVGGISGVVAALTTATLAYKGLQEQASKGVGPGQGVSNEIASLKNNITGLQQVAANGIGPGLINGLDKIDQILPTLVPNVEKMSAALGDAAGHLAGGVGNALQAATPLFDAFDSVMVKLSEDFEKFTASDDFKEFINNAAQDLPAAVSVVEDLGSAFVHLANDLAPVARMLLTVADAVAKVVNALPDGFSGALLAAGLGAYLGRGASGVGGLLGGGVGGAAGALRGGTILGGVALAGGGLANQATTGNNPMNYLSTVGGATLAGSPFGAGGALAGFVAGNVAYIGNSIFNNGANGGTNANAPAYQYNPGGSFFKPSTAPSSQQLFKPVPWFSSALQSATNMISVPQNLRIGAGDLGFTAAQQKTIFAGTGQNLLTYSDTPGAGRNLSTAQQGGLAGAALDTTMSRYQPALDALDQYQTAQQNVSQAVRDENRVEVQGAQQVSAAQQSLQNARHQAAESAIADAAAIKSAQQAVHNAEEQQADDAHSSAEAVTAATKQVTQAQEDAADAQKNLTQARKDATRQLQDFTRAAVDSGDSLQSAQLRQSQLQLQEAARTGSLTPDQIFARYNQLQGQGRNLDLKTAHDDVTDAQIAHTRAVNDNNEAQKKGVEGSDQVVAAKKALKTANDNVATSEQNLADTRHNAARTEERDAQNVATSVANLETARRTAANDRKTNEQNVANAVTGVATAEDNAKQANDDATQRTNDAKTAAGNAAANFDTEATKIGLSRTALLNMATAIKDHKLDVVASFDSKNQNPVARTIVDMQRQVETLTLIAQGESAATARANAAKAFPYPAGTGATQAPPALPRGGKGQSWYTAGSAASGGPINGPGGPKDDQVAMHLSAGEHVWTAKEVQNVGGHKAMEEIRAHYRAEGGPVGPTIDFKRLDLANKIKTAGLMAGPGAAAGPIYGGGLIGNGGGFSGLPHNAAIIAELLLNGGFNPIATAGVLGNLRWESDFSPTALNSIGAYGIVQWLGSRKTALQNYAADRHTSAASLPIQVGFLLQEARNRGFISKMNAEPSAALAANLWNDQFEVSGDTSNHRPMSATQYYANYHAAAANASFAAGSTGPVPSHEVPAHWSPSDGYASKYIGRHNPPWPAPVHGHVSANTAAAGNYVRHRWGIPVDPSANRTGDPFDHPWGKANDNMINGLPHDQGVRTGWQIANWFAANPKTFGTKYILWNHRANQGAHWEPLDIADQHTSHVHTSFYDQGGMLAPGATLAINQSRKPEAVLNEPQWRLLRQIARNRGGAMQHVETQIIQTPQAADMLVRMLQFASLAAGGGSL